MRIIEINIAIKKWYIYKIRYKKSHVFFSIILYKKGTIDCKSQKFINDTYLKNIRLLHYNIRLPINVSKELLLKLKNNNYH